MVNDDSCDGPVVDGSCGHLGPTYDPLCDYDFLALLLWKHDPVPDYGNVHIDDQFPGISWD